MSEKRIIVKREQKVVYQEDNLVVKVFNNQYLKSDIFNEALNHVRIEETGLPVPKLEKVFMEDDKWAIAVEYIKGKNLQTLMMENPAKMPEYLDQFLDLQIQVHEQKSPLLNKVKDKLNRQISSLKDILDATTRYELHTRLEGMPRHNKVLHGDFNPSNIIVKEDGSMYILDWAHATQGNAAADVARTYLLFALQDETIAQLYLQKYCDRTDTAKQYVQQWMPIVAAGQLTKNIEAERELLLKWVNIMDYA